jgi:hypothetical protein
MNSIVVFEDLASGVELEALKLKLVFLENVEQNKI